MADLEQTTADISAEALELLRLAGRLRGLLDQVVDQPGALIQLLMEVSADREVGAAELTVQLSAHVSDRALRLLAALRAGNVNLRVIEAELGHALTLPSVVRCVESAGPVADADAQRFARDPAARLEATAEEARGLVVDAAA